MIKKGIPLNNRKLVNTILYADDKILMISNLRRVLNVVCFSLIWPGLEGDHSPPTAVLVKSEWRYISILQYALKAWIKTTLTSFNFTYTYNWCHAYY